MNNHCVFYRTNLRYDGRVTALIHTLSLAFPKDKIILYEYPINNDIYEEFPDNVKIIKAKLFTNTKKYSHFLQYIKAIEYGIRSLILLLKYKPLTIQAHHEIVLLGPLVYKIFNSSTKIIYDDKEMYHYRDKNIPRILYWIEFKLIQQSKLIICCNKYRLKALKYIHKNKSLEFIIIDNFVFKDTNEISKDTIDKIDLLKKTQKKILLHQGIIKENRGSAIINKIIQNLDDQWIVIFIGAKEDNFTNFSRNLDSNYKDKIINLGYINYNELNYFYKNIDASIVMYDSNTFNNNYCAPNRLYSSVNNGKPIIVNLDNRVLNNFILKYNTGIAFDNNDSLNYFFRNFQIFKDNASLLIKQYEYSSFIPVLLEYYKKLPL